MPSSSKYRFAIASFVLALLAAPIPAQAAFLAYLCDDALCTGGGDTVVLDQGAGDNFPGSAIPGQISAGAVNIGGFVIATNTANTGSAGSPSLHLSFRADTTDSSPHTLWLYASATGFTLPNGSYALTVNGGSTGSGNSIVARAYGGNSNTNLNFANLLTTVNASTAAFNLSSTGGFASSTNPFALLIGIVITRGNAGSTFGDLDLQIAPTVVGVPEPESALLLALGLVALGRCRRRRTRDA